MLSWWVVGAVTRYVYDNEDVVLEYDGSNVLQASYTHGQGIDEPLIMERGGNSLFYHTDGLGSIVDLTDNLGAVVQSYVYDSFGNIVLQNGSLTNPFTYTGREFDSESGLYYYRARYYDASIGRFLQEDPTGLVGGINLYDYVFQNPINLVDPSGLDSYIATDPTFPGHELLVIDAPDRVGGFIVFEFVPTKRFTGIFFDVPGTVRERRFGLNEKFPFIEVPFTRIKQDPIKDKMTIERARNLKKAAESGDLRFLAIPIFGAESGELNCIGFIVGVRSGIN